MGKNQAYKAMQRAKMGSSSAGGPEEIEDGMMDGSFHSPEWHAARLASLKTSHTVTWEEFKRRQKEDATKKGELEADKDRMMKEYRAQLDAERASKLARGRNHADKRHSMKKGRKDKDKDRWSSKKRKHSGKRHQDTSSSDSDSSSSDDERNSKREKSKSRRSKKDRKHKSRRKRSRSSSSDSSSVNEEHGPLPLSSFFDDGKRGLQLGSNYSEQEGESLAHVA